MPKRNMTNVCQNLKGMTTVNVRAYKQQFIAGNPQLLNCHISPQETLSL